MRFARHAFPSTASISRFNYAGLLIAMILIIAVSGCGSGERRYRVSGTVTYKGNPVPEGYVVFEPDGSKGNKGGPGRAKIINGKYDTSQGENEDVLSGPHIIRIQGFDSQLGKSSSGEVGLPKALFTDFSVSEDIPQKAYTRDFDVK